MQERTAGLAAGARRVRERTVGFVSQHVIPHCSAQWVSVCWQLPGELHSVRMLSHPATDINTNGPRTVQASLEALLAVGVISTAGSDSLCDISEGPAVRAHIHQPALSSKDAK